MKSIFLFACLFSFCGQTQEILNLTSFDNIIITDKTLSENEKKDLLMEKAEIKAKEIVESLSKKFFGFEFNFVYTHLIFMDEELKAKVLSIIEKKDTGPNLDSLIELFYQKFKNQYFIISKEQLLRDIEEQKLALDSFENLALYMLFKKKAEFLEGPVLTIRSSELISDSSIYSYRVRMNALGTIIMAGPEIQFKESYTSQAIFVGPGPTPFIDEEGKILSDKQVLFSCRIQMTVESQYTGKGFFMIGGLGKGNSRSKNYSTDLKFETKPIKLPRIIGETVTNLKILSDFCHNVFIKTQTELGISLKDTLSFSLKSTISSLTIDQPETTCLEDKHCEDWFSKQDEKAREGRVARCVVEDDIDQIKICAIRSLEGASCPHYIDGKKVTKAKYEYPCDNGLECSVTQKGKWIAKWYFPFPQSWKAHCKL